MERKSIDNAWELPVQSEDATPGVTSHKTSPEVVDRASAYTSNPSRPSILESFRAQVADHPHAIAVCAADGEMTYTELDTTSTRLASHLCSLGVGPDVFVPLLFHRCQWVVVAQLAVLKAGGAFVPLEPSHPDLRLASIVQHTNCGFVVASDVNKDRAALLADKTVCIDCNFVSGLPVSDEMLPSPSPNTPAYVLFTSGSTGQPKGCVIEHGAMANLPEQASLVYIGLSASSRVLQFASYSFAMSINEIYFALVRGATICIPSDHDRINRLPATMEELGVTWACITPSLLRSLDSRTPPSNLKTIILGGEAVRNGEFDDWTARTSMVYIYGASENSGFIGLAPHQSEGVAFRPHPSMKFWLVDAEDHHSLVPVGTIGELVINGLSLGRGYLNDPESTSAVFIDAPAWHPCAGQTKLNTVHLYKTGDLFRCEEDGTVRHVGRKGTQAKIRGNRVDLAEVEFHVRKSCPGVTQVIAETGTLADESETHVLVAFLYSPDYIREQKETLFAVPSDRFRSDVQVIQTELKKLLPEHMLPSSYVPLLSMPLTITGKIDRLALRERLQKCTRAELDIYHSIRDVDVTLPTTSLERSLHSVFAQVLTLDHGAFGVHHSFLRLGGDSVSAMRVVGLFRSNEYPPLAVADVLSLETVSKLAVHVESVQAMAPAAKSVLKPFSMIQEKEQAVALAAEQCGVPISAVEDIYPCTALQAGLMVSTIKVPGQYIARFVFQLAKDTNLSRLQSAWQVAVNSNSILRTRIVQSPSHELVQAVLYEGQSGIEWKSYSSVDAYRSEDSDLSMGPGDPLARFSVIQDASGPSIALTLHHAVFDMHSLGLVLEQVKKAYYKERLQVQSFGPFIQFIENQDRAAERNFWQHTFSDLRASVFPSLPNDAVVPKATANLQRTVNLSLLAGSRATLSNIVRLAWGVVVSNHTESEDVVFGATVTGRAAPVDSIENITGPAIATVPVRVICPREKTVAEILSTVQTQAIQMIPFEQTGLQNIRQISPEAAAACDFQSQLIFQRPEHVPEDDVPPVMYGKGDAYGGDNYSVFINYVIGLICTPSDDGDSLHIRAQFDPDLLPRVTTSRLVTQFANILQQICRDQHRLLRELDLVSQEELNIIKQWNGGDLSPESPNTLHDIVLENARKEPLATAVTSWDRQLTYESLASLSADVAQQIIQAGVQLGARVALCFEKSSWPVVSMLAVLRAGAAVVNIDPALPPARIEAIVKTSQPSLILSSSAMRHVMDSLQTGVPLLEVPCGKPAPAATPAEWPSVHPHDVAFILFTSGSTGTPKGIVIEHRNFTSALHSIGEAAGAHSGMRTLHFCSYAWDVSMEEVFLTWVHGGCLCIPSETQRMSNLAGFIEEYRVNWAAMTPSAAMVLSPDEVPGLKTLRLCGENIPVEMMEMWSSRVRLINGFGPAEAYTCGSLTIEPGMHFPGRIGHLFGSAGWVVVADDVNRLAAVGAVGELLIEGPTVTRGYFNDPRKSRQAFIEAPEWLRKIRPGGIAGRIYRTGDLARYDENGYLHYMGRKDSQVKLRGQRLVLGDIEHQVQLHFPSAVQAVAEIIRPREAAAALLVVFIARESVGFNGDDSLLQDPDEELLHQSASATARIQDALPAHMVPSAILPVYQIPRGRTGKIDRRTLREAAEQLSPEELQSYVVGANRADSAKEPPRTAAEMLWQALWARVLSIPESRIGRDDHLFRIGGDSIHAMKLAALARKAGLAHVTFQDIFHHPCLKDIAVVAGTSTEVGTLQGPLTLAPFALVDDIETLLPVASNQCGTSVDRIEDIYPCTPMQAALIASTIHQPDAYMACKSFILADGVDTDKLKRAWEIVAEAHPILRTRITQTSTGTCYQVVLKEPLSWSYQEDHSTSPEPAVGLGTSLVSLILCPGHLLLSIHHALYDAWSLRLLVDEVDRAYRQLPLEPLTPFKKFIAHVESCMESAAVFWKEELQNVDALHFPALPSLNYRPKPQSFIRRTIALPETPKSHDATIASKIKLAWALVSRTYTNSDDIIFGVTSSGRTAPVVGIEGIAGPTLATAPLRLRLDPTQSLAEALDKLQNHSVRQMGHEQLGLQQISQQSESAATACQFQTLVVVDPKEVPESEHLWYCHAEFLSDTNHFSSHALLLHCQPLLGDSDISVTVTFDSAVVPSAQMDRIFAQFEHILLQIHVADMDAMISDLEFVSPHDWNELIEWNVLAYQQDVQCVHSLVHERCQIWPDSVAIHAWDGDFTYRQLDEHVAQLSHHIQRLDVVHPNTFVALYFERSRWTIVAQLAVLRAGGAITMLDSSQPTGRLRDICTDIQPVLILTSPAQKNFASALFDAPVLIVESALPAQLMRCVEAGSHGVRPSDAMYTITTSGTTGKPKVVVIEHRSFVANTKPVIKRMAFNCDTRTLQFTSYGFDPMYIEHFMTLLAGGCICIPSQSDLDNRLAQVITEMGANWATLTSSVIQLLSPEVVPTMRTLIQGGEPMQQSVVDRWASHVRLVNAYGPSECSIVSCISDPFCPDTYPNTIGRATGGSAWIVHPETLDPLPIGAEGELIIEGAIVGRGYFNNPERTAAAYIPVPSWLQRLRVECEEARVYRTGDLVKYNSEGEIVYIRRKDSQTKLRGQRLELMEVEHHVQQCFPDALQAVAAISSLGTSTGALVALVLCASASGQSSNEGDILLPAASTSRFLKDAHIAEAALQERVPAYMVPNLFIPVSRIPRDVNGKVDRRQINNRLASLSRLEADSYRSASTVVVPPQNDIQRDIRGIWAVVLNIPPEEIGINKSFFRIGGDSITSMQVAAQSGAVGIPITVQDLFKYRTIEQLALHTVRSHSEVAKTEEDDIIDTPVDLSPIQQMFFDCAPPSPNYFTQTFPLHLGKADMSGRTLAQALDVLVQTHSMLRARFEKGPDDRWMQRIPSCVDGSSYRHRDHGVQSQDSIEAICRISQRSLDIQHGPLLIVDQFQRDDGRLFISLVAHHLVIDLVSWRVILADLEQLLTTESVPAIPSMPFLRWCQLQADYATRCLPAPQNEAETVTAFWGIDAISHNTHADVDSYGFSLDEETSQILIGRANEALTTQPVEIIQAAVLHSFVQLFPDRPAPVIFSEGHGREPWDASVDLSRTVGWFTTVWPTTVSLAASEGLVTALRRTKDARRQTPANGWQYFTSQHLHPQGAKTMGDIEIVLNYQGRYQQLERVGALLTLDAGNELGVGDIAEDMPRFGLLDVSAHIIGDRLRLQFLVNRRMRHQDRLQKWAEQCERSLRGMADKLPSMMHRHTVSDFPLLGTVTSDQVDRSLQEIIPRLDGEIEEIYPTTPVQQGMLLSQARNPGYYQQVMRWKVIRTQADGAPLDVRQLERAWQQVVDRHPALRTVFVELSEGSMDQLVLKGVSVAIQIPTDNATKTDRIRPSACLHLQKSTLDEILVELEINHALIDGPSERILRRDLALAYGGHLSPSHAPSYRDYVAYLQSTTGSGPNGEAYWRGYLDSAIPCIFPNLTDGSTMIPCDNKKQAEFGSLFVELGSTPNMEEFCEEHGLALSSVYQAVWAIVLQCYTGLTSVCFGHMVTGRSVPVPGVQDIVGPAMNLHVAHLHIQPEASVLSVLQQYHDDRLRSLKYQSYSFAKILQAVGATGNELFNTSISVQDRRRQGAGIDETLTTVSVEEYGGEDRSEESFIPRKHAATIGQTFAQVLSEVISRPSHLVRDIELLDPAQRTLLATRNSVVPEAVTDHVHHAIHRLSLDHPTAHAVCAWDGDFTFEELDRLSTILSEELIQQGVGIEMPIPLYLDKSRWTPVALLAVLKAGAAFLLLDTSHPLIRLRAIFEDTKARLVLASSTLVKEASNLASCVIDVGDRLLSVNSNDTHCHDVHVNGSNAAYFIFTSGSTGKPKGIVIHHSSLATSLDGMIRRWGITATCRMLQFGSHAFDIAVAELLLPLVAGGCVCIPSNAERGGDITGAMNRMEVNFAMATPTVARSFNPDQLKHLKTLILAGEAISAADLAIWCGKVILFGGYGPAECAMCSASTPVIVKSDNPRNIGFSSGCVTWVVDRDDYHRLVPEGAVGELLVEGPNVARGYLNNPLKTAEVFVEAPCWLKAIRGERQTILLYRTGDLVRFAEDGSLIFVGRQDHQIKIRGQRLELGEVESQVSRAFCDSLVLVELVKHVDSPFLVAYVLQRVGDDATGNTTALVQVHPPSETFSNAVRAAVDQLHEAMPSYMIPSAFLPLAELPKGATGKTDRKCLREHAASLSREELEAYSAIVKSRRVPSTPLEAQLQELVACALNRSPDSIPLDEDIFQAGLDSMKAMSLAGSARRAGLSLTVQAIFRHPRLSDLAAVLEGEDDEAYPPPPPSALLEHADELCAKWHIDRNNVLDIIPATYYQRTSIESHHLAHVTIHFPQLLDEIRLKDAVVATIERHPILRTVFVPFENTHIQIVLRQVDLPVQTVRTDNNPEEVLLAICHTDAAKPVPFASPTLQLFVVTSKTRMSLALRVNHAHYDGMTVLFLIREIGTLYANSTADLPASLEYPEFIAHRVQRTRPAAFEFWRGLLQGSSMTHLTLYDETVGFPKRSRMDLLVNSWAEIPMPELQGGVTMATVLKSAWAVCLAEYTKRTDVVFAQISSHRALPIDRIDRTVGPCVNYLPVRVPLQADWTAKELFHWVQGQHIRGMSHDTIDWDEMVARSTEWHPDSPPGTGLHWLNASGLWDTDYLFGGCVPARNRHVDTQMLHRHPMMMCVPVPAADGESGGVTMLRMMLMSPTFGQEVADRLVERFRGIVVRLTARPEELVLGGD
ncbi:acetyl-CoA synthetase-like protein [Aspergillus heteromorphus CBS 117.55]|uniref:Acetyl-CoA synthetase-like protein n=1 Tax=Aspergillus heteromorphus CBS 117.55 TaxID=1448321 RepID=A0A317WKZ4_9EURO|nr:acetyl-CoA synthetase-like protein [Aspergillus heteromorphus CBS 117.55]PWY86735.1 acetyl-CoA synthetase-like protein [Aspergillus heteromorphus CBS 117.55]